MQYVADLDTTLLQLTPDDLFTLRDAVQGVHVFGGIGSGKTSGSGAALAGAYLRAGMGGLVLCAKPDEVTRWERYAAQHGRSASLLRFDGSQGFNFLDYGLARHGLDGINSVVECLMRVLDAARKASPDAGKAGDQFWEDATRQVLRYTIPPLHIAYGRVTVEHILRFVTSAPENFAQVAADADWQTHSFMHQTMERCFNEPALPIADAALMKIADYWGKEYTAIPMKTRGNIQISLSAALDRFRHGRLERAFCGATTLLPELCLHGAIILMDMPALEWEADGIIGQQLFKFMWQQAMLKRNGLPEKHRTRPVFLWADEAQHFVNAHDASFQSTCRDSRVCTVFLTQSLPSYYASMAGDKGRDHTHQLIGNFATRVFHSNACAETNEWAARTLGRRLQRRGNYSEGTGSSRSVGVNQGGSRQQGTNASGGTSSSAQGSSSQSSSGSSSSDGESWGSNRNFGTSRNVSRGYNEAMDYVIEPSDFGRTMKTGGAPHGGVVSGIWYQAGRQFRTSDENFLHVSFRQ